MSDQVPAKWDATQIQSQKGKRVIVTGANSGIGFITALELARHGADVVLACRSEEKGKEAVKEIQKELKLLPEAGSVEFRKLDVSSLASVKAFADEFKSSEDRVDLLINNAGIMAVPYALTEDGFESHFATNHLGHFALTAQLLELLKKLPRARIVNVSSSVHRTAKMDLNEIVTPKEKYDSMQVYSNSKVYNLLFTFELNRRLQKDGVSNVLATSCHPGFTTTNLQATIFDNVTFFQKLLYKFIFLMPIKQEPAMGALPTLYAATADNVKADDFFGPEGFMAMKGFPAREKPGNVSESETHAAALWAESERMAKLKFAI